MKAVACRLCGGGVSVYELENGICPDCWDKHDGVHDFYEPTHAPIVLKQPKSEYL